MRAKGIDNEAPALTYTGPAEDGSAQVQGNGGSPLAGGSGGLVASGARQPASRPGTPSRSRPSGVSAMDVKEVLLPSMGVRYEFTSNHGERIGIIARRGGDFEVVLYGSDDPDQARPSFASPTRKRMRSRRFWARPASPNGSSS